MRRLRSWGCRVAVLAAFLGILSACGAKHDPESPARPDDRPFWKCDEVTEEASFVSIYWRLASQYSAACETTLRPNSVVGVRIEGANPAVANYRLVVGEVSEVITTPAPSAGAAEPPAREPTATPAPVVQPTLQQQTGTMRALSLESETANPETAPANERQRLETVFVLREARDFILRAADQFPQQRTLPTEVVCDSVSSVGPVEQLPPPADYWGLTQGVVILRRVVDQVFQEVLPPTDTLSVDRAKSCIQQLRRHPTWGTLLSSGGGLAARHFGESRANLNSMSKRSEALRQQLTNLSLRENLWTGDQLAALYRERSELLAELTEISARTEGALAADFSNANLEAVTDAFREAARLASLIEQSSASAYAEVTVGNVRGRSRDIRLAWDPRLSYSGLRSGSQTILIDRFKGPLVSVNTAAGFAGVRIEEVLRRSAFTEEGAFLSDSVDLIGNSRYTWRPAVSTGLSFDYQWLNGFRFGLGVDLAVLTENDGNSATRIAFPILHLGRDNVRIFAGPLLGARDDSAIPEDGAIRVGATDSIPPTLILPNRDWFGNLYIGIVFAGASLDPTRLSR